MTTSRAHLLRPVLDANGNVLSDLHVKLYEPGTTTVISENVYADRLTNSPLAQPITFTNGIIDVYLDAPKRVRIGVVQGTAPEVFYEDIDITATSAGAGFRPGAGAGSVVGGDLNTPATATGTGALALGDGATATGARALAVGPGATAATDDSSVVKTDQLELVPSSPTGKATTLKLHESTNGDAHVIGVTETAITFDGVAVGGGTGGGGNGLLTYTVQDIKTGNLAVAASAFPPGLRVPENGNAIAFVARLGTPPTGADVIIKAERWNDGGYQNDIATLTIPAGTTLAAVSGLAIGVAKGDIVHFNVTQVGSTTPGADLNVSLDLTTTVPLLSGGGGGVVNYGRFVPAVNDASQMAVFDAQRGITPPAFDAGGGGYYVNGVGETGFTSSLIPSGTSAFAGDHDIPAIDHAWFMGPPVPYENRMFNNYGQLQFGVGAHLHTTPFRMDIVYRAPINEPAAVCFWVATNAYDTTDGRSIPIEYALDNSTDWADDPSDYALQFADGPYAGSSWKVATVTLPAGISTIMVGQTAGSDYIPIDPGVAGYDPHHEGYSVAFVRLTPLAPGSQGEVYIQQQDQSIWAYDAATDPLTVADGNTAVGQGWYLIKRPTIIGTGQQEYVAFTEQLGITLGQMEFQDPQDMGGNRLAVACDIAIPMEFYVTIPAQASGPLDLQMTSMIGSSAPMGRMLPVGYEPLTSRFTEAHIVVGRALVTGEVFTFNTQINSTAVTPMSGVANIQSGTLGTGKKYGIGFVYDSTKAPNLFHSGDFLELFIHASAYQSASPLDVMITLFITPKVLY